LSYIVERLLLAYLLRYDQETDEWTLQSGFDGDELLSRPSIELVTVDSVIAKEAEQHIESCEHCHPGDAEIPFDWLLAEVIGKRGPYEFVLSEPARCPNCKHAITEKDAHRTERLNRTSVSPNRCSLTNRLSETLSLTRDSIFRESSDLMRCVQR